MYDLCYFMRRLLKRSNTNWDIDLTRKIIKTYNSIAPLTEDDFISSISTKILALIKGLL